MLLSMIVVAVVASVVIWSSGYCFCLLVLWSRLVLFHLFWIDIGISILFQATIDIMLLWFDRCFQSVCMFIVVVDVFVISVVAICALMLTCDYCWSHFRLLFIFLASFKFCLSCYYKYIGLHLFLLLIYNKIY